MGKKEKKESKEERKARKREKKEAKKRRKQEKRDKKEERKRRKRERRSVGYSEVVDHDERQSKKARIGTPAPDTDEVLTTAAQSVLPPPSVLRASDQSGAKASSLIQTSIPTIDLEEDDDDPAILQSSPFRLKKVELIVSLYPAALADVMKYVRQSICSMLLKYSEGIEGVMLAFQNVQILGNKEGRGRGRILNDMPHVHFTVRLDALVFCPAVGMKLTGVTNESFPSHVGMLVYSFFNAMVSSDHLRAAGYFYDRDAQQWIKPGNSTDGTESGTVLGVDDRLTFTVEKLHECSGIISMEGSLPLINTT